ncbi:hypothetical protein BX265_4041 [Streptomyces sp. TLI_235]|nr:hypothetical protein [Streptomyces sp. TLI_235]PBC79246.1 hypothetical protein BX265_4041 [Streptomyces sp. TLI_235]
MTVAAAAPAAAIDPDAVLLHHRGRPAVSAPAPVAPADDLAVPSLPSPPSLPHVPALPALPAVPDLSPVPGLSPVLGSLDGVLGLVDGVVALTSSLNGGLGLAALQQKIDEWQAAVMALLGGLPVQVPAARPRGGWAAGHANAVGAPDSARSGAPTAVTRRAARRPPGRGRISGSSRTGSRSRGPCP